ncbi:MAG: class II aldolase/adducin family protein [Clostridia bacterium]|nr:class II aldolase/adducin family protein [Clostridia bacterium]
MNLELLEQFRRGGELISGLDYETGNARLFIESEGHVYSTKEGTDLSEIQESDIEVEACVSLPSERKSMVLSYTPYLMKCLDKAVTFTAPLDDMAQIVGPVFRISDCQNENFLTSAKVRKNLRKTNATLVISDVKDGTISGFTLTVGRDIIEAVTALMVLEKCAKASLLASVLSTPKPVNYIFARKMKKIYDGKYSNNLINGFTHNSETEMSEREAQLRQEIVEHGLKLVSSRLVERSWGNISARLDEKYMLVTPSGIEYKDLLPQDIVKVDIETLEYEGGLRPTSEKNLHALIYRTRNDVNAIVHTHSDCLSAFAVAWEDMPILKKYRKELGEKIKCSFYGMSTTEKLAVNTVKAIENNTGAIIANHGMVSVGKSVSDAFRKAELLEDNAKEIIRLGEEK